MKTITTTDVSTLAVAQKSGRARRASIRTVLARWNAKLAQQRREGGDAA